MMLLETQYQILRSLDYLPGDNEGDFTVIAKHSYAAIVENKKQIL